MALKAGRVGVAPDQVDEFGNVKSDATSGYTKQEADAKFETQTHAASTYETKSDAAELQPITLALPIELLSGSALTVEDALQGINSEVNQSLIFKGVIPSGDDLNDYVETGMYNITGTSPAHMPSGSSGYVPLIVLGNILSRGNTKQIIVSRANELYIRNMNAGEAWGNWYKYTGTEVV